jgi:hypothetical protein
MPAYAAFLQIVVLIFIDCFLLQQRSSPLRFVHAGYETTANTLAFTTYSLAANPDKAAKLVEVITFLRCSTFPERRALPRHLPYKHML